MNKPRLYNSSVNCRQQQGVAAIEFALLLTLLLMILAGVVEFGRTFWYYDALAKATRDSARFLSNIRVSKDVALDATLTAEAESIVVNAAISAHVPDFNAGHVTVACDTECDKTPTYITVSVAYPITIGGLIPIIIPTGSTTWSVTLSPHTTMRYMK